MTREEIEEIMGNEPKIQASFEVIGDDVKFIKLIVNGKENIVSVEELENTLSEPCRETDDYENEIADLHNRLDIAEYDKERFREEITVLEEKLKALSVEPCDCISRAELLKAVDTWDRFGCDAGSSKLVPIKDCYVPYIHYDDVVKAIKGMPSVQLKTEWIPVSERLPENHDDVLVWIEYIKDDWDCAWWGLAYYSLQYKKWVVSTNERNPIVKAWIPLPEPYEPTDSEKE